MDIVLVFEVVFLVMLDLVSLGLDVIDEVFGV